MVSVVPLSVHPEYTAAAVRWSIQAWIRESYEPRWWDTMARAHRCTIHDLVPKLFLEHMSRDLAGDAAARCFVAHNGRRPLGMGQLTLLEANDFPGRFARVDGLYVHPEDRSRGVATAIVARCTDETRVRSITSLRAFVEHANGGLFVKLGWRPTGRVLERGASEWALTFDDGAPAADGR